jgi:hypothetical protein
VNELTHLYIYRPIIPSFLCDVFFTLNGFKQLVNIAFVWTS